MVRHVERSGAPRSASLFPPVVEELLAVVRRLSLARDLAAVQQTVAEAARSLTGADGATFVLQEDGYCYYADESAISPLWKNRRFPMDTCISGWVMSRGEPAVIPDIYRDPRIPVDVYRPTFVRSLLMVPVRPEAPVAAIGTYWAREREFDAPLVELLQALADSASVALESVHHYQELAKARQALEAANETLERKVAERTAAAEQRARQLQALALQLGEAEEAERRRIAELLHEDLQQLLSASLLQLSTLRPALRGDVSAAPRLAQVDRLLKQSIEKSRRLSHDLSPAVLHQAGLAAAIEWLADRLKVRHGLEVELDDRDWQVMDNDALRIFLYRAVEEMLLNVVKHSGKLKARVRLGRAGDRAEVVVEDHGRGFDPGLPAPRGDRGRGLSLFSIRERASFLGGSLEIESAPGAGCRLTLTVPLPPPQPLPSA